MTDTGLGYSEVVCESLQEFSQLQSQKNVYSAHCEEVAELVLPTSRNTFYYGNYNTPGQKKTERQTDASAMMALSRFAAILDSLLTPRNMTWHGLEASDDYLMKDRGTRLYFEQLTRVLFKNRYSPIANFSAQNQNYFQSLGAFGTGTMFIDSYQGIDGEKGLRYRACPMGEMFLRENHQGLVDGFHRWFRLTARQAAQRWPDTIPENLRAAMEQKSETPFNFLHRVVPRGDYDPERMDHKGKLWASYYICLDMPTLLSEGGYNTFPLAASRYEQTPGEVYGRGPAMMVLPAIKTLNEEKRDFLTQGHRAVSPIMLTSDDGIVDFSMRPGAINKGGWNSETGRAMVGTLPIGNIQTSKEMMDEERSLINDAFLVTLFQVLVETPTMTATEVIERTNEKGILLAPTVGRQQSEYLGPSIHRELDVLASQGMLPPMPPLLKEAGGNYHVVYTSPLSRQMHAQEVAGFQRTLETATNVANATGDPSILDCFDFDTALPEIAQIQSTPERWMAGPEKLAQKRQARAQAAQQQQQIQAAPAAAAMMKAQAIAAKSGMQPQQGQEQQQ